MARKGPQRAKGTGRGQVTTGTGVEEPKPSRGGMEEGGPGAAVTTATLSHEQIAERAREIWERRGRPEGEDEKIWLEAEEQLARELRTR